MGDSGDSIELDKQNLPAGVTVVVGEGSGAPLFGA